MSKKYADIIIDISHEAIDRSFQYEIPKALEEQVQIGTQVVIPFGKGNHPRKGYVTGISEQPAYDEHRIKQITEVVKRSVAAPNKLIALAAWIRETYGSTMIQALKTVLPVKKTVKASAYTASALLDDTSMNGKPEIVLNPAQQSIVDRFASDLESDRHHTYLLHGVTGSGKTEIYVRAIEKVVAKHKQAIVLIPEIALTYQTVRYFRAYFHDRVTVINSRLSAGEKYDQFMKAKKGEVDVVIGPRSALFAPFEHLGLIIIDEEHENSYKSEYPPRYHARETAIKRAQLEGASVILGSATPSVESYQKAMNGEYVLWTLPERASGGALAETSVVDLREELRRGNRSVISSELASDIRDRLDKKQQIMLFINKRGYNSFISCRNCGEALKCPHCDVSLTKHQGNRLLCHYCGYSMIQPDICPSCKSRLIGGYGTGTQKVEEEIHRLFPDAATIRMDKDTTSVKNAHERLLEQFENREADILIGTQMIVKGHDFSNVTLVGILLADLTLFHNDYRAGERTFDLLAQAAGRAGRGRIPGKVVIQSYQPEHYAIVSAAKQDYRMFYESEYAYRQMMKYPPVWNMMVILLTSKEELLLDAEAGLLADKLKLIFAEDGQMQMIGPSVPVIAKIKDIYRRVVYVKHNRYNKLVEIKDYIEAYIEQQKLDEQINVIFDFNPMNIY